MGQTQIRQKPWHRWRVVESFGIVRFGVLVEDSSLSTRYDSPSRPYLADGTEEICFVAKECQFSFCIYVMTREAIR